MKFRFSEKFRIARFRAHYKAFYPAEMESRCRSFLTKNLSTIPLDKPILIINNNDWMRQSFLYLFMRKGFVNFRFLSAYTLLDIYLGNHEDFKSVMDISCDVLCLYLGYGEFENKRQVDVIVQVINNLVMEGKTVWLYCKVPSLDICNLKFPGLVQFFTNSGFTVVSRVLGKGPVGASDDIL
jgi:hypothetical protein